MADEGHNLTQLKADIVEANRLIDEYEDDKSNCSEDIKAVRERLVAKGIPAKALQMARTYLKMDEKDRRGFDTAYGIVREALGAPVQSDLFDEIKPPEPKRRGRPPRAESAPDGATVQ